MFIKRNAFLLVILILICNCAPNDQSKKYPANVEEKINQVENNLAGWVQTGTNDRWNLTKRMKQYGINGVSIAVVHNYKIEWARGYGFADISEKRPVTEATLFQAASISKSLNRQLPDYGQIPPICANISLRPSCRTKVNHQGC